MRIGDVTITALADGSIALPPTQAYPTTADEDWVPHRRWLNHDGLLEIPIGCFLIRTAGRTILVDCGLGPLDRGAFVGGKLLDELAAHGVAPGEVSDVVFTHLHFDHVGWATQQGEIVFGNATYRCDRRDWAHFVGGDDPGSVRKLTPLESRMEFWDGTTTIAPGLDTLPTPGHTPGHSALVVSSGADRAVILGDATHCPVELEESEWDGLGDVDPALARRTREAMFTELEADGTLATASHFPDLAFGRVLRGEGKRLWSVD